MRIMAGERINSTGNPSSATTAATNNNESSRGRRSIVTDDEKDKKQPKEEKGRNNKKGASNTVVVNGDGGVGGETPHSRVGGIPDPAADDDRVLIPSLYTNNNKNSNNSPATDSQQQMQPLQRQENEDCRGMTFVQLCQVRLKHLFPQLTSPSLRCNNICDETIELTAECIAKDVIRYLLKEEVHLISTDPVSRSMRHNVYQMLNKHSILFTSMVNRLDVVPDTAYEAFVGVADELFDQGITWARIVCLYAFMGRLALWARDRKMNNLKKKLPLYVSRYITEHMSYFIQVYGGWEQLCIEYPVAEEISGAVWRSLLMTGATLGLVATILTVTS